MSIRNVGKAKIFLIQSNIAAKIKTVKIRVKEKRMQLTDFSAREVGFDSVINLRTNKKGIPKKTKKQAYIEFLSFGGFIMRGFDFKELLSMMFTFRNYCFSLCVKYFAICSRGISTED